MGKQNNNSVEVYDIGEHYLLSSMLIFITYRAFKGLYINSFTLFLREGKIQIGNKLFSYFFFSF